MSKMGMLGLLEGLGKGITSTGQAVEKMTLLQAEEQRKMNLARIQREWANEDEGARYKRDLADKERLVKEGREYEEGQNVIKRAQTVADQDKALKAAEQKAKDDHTRKLEEIDHQANATARNRQPTEAEKKLAEIQKLREEGKISEDQYKSYLLGLQKTQNFTAKDLAEFKLKSLEQATLEIRGKDPLQTATPEEKKAIAKRSAEIYSGLVGGAGGAGGGLLEAESGQPAIDLHPKMKTDIATKLAAASPEQLPTAMKTLQAKGLTTAQIDEVMKEAEDIRAKRDEKKVQSETDTSAGLEKAQRGEGLLSEGAYRILNDMPAPQETAPPANNQQLTQRQRRDRQTFSGQAPWLQR